MIDSVDNLRIDDMWEEDTVNIIVRLTLAPKEVAIQVRDELRKIVKIVNDAKKKGVR